MHVLAVANYLARVVVALVLIHSSTAKLRSGSTFMDVLRQLGIKYARAGWLVVAAAELAAAVSLSLPVAPYIPALGVLLLGLAFAAAGVRAITVGKSIECACFGEGSQRFLGWRQLLYLPLWVLAAGIIAVQRVPDSWDVALMGALIISVTASSYAVSLLRVACRTRADRLVMASIIGQVP